MMPCAIGNADSRGRCRGPARSRLASPERSDRLHHRVPFPRRPRKPSRIPTPGRSRPERRRRASHAHQRMNTSGSQPPGLESSCMRISREARTGLALPGEVEQNRDVRHEKEGVQRHIHRKRGRDHRGGDQRSGVRRSGEFRSRARLASHSVVYQPASTATQPANVMATRPRASLRSAVFPGASFHAANHDTIASACHAGP